MSDAAIAEIEAGVYGLQVRNYHFNVFILWFLTPDAGFISLICKFLW